MNTRSIFFCFLIFGLSHQISAQSSADQSGAHEERAAAVKAGLQEIYGPGASRVTFIINETKPGQTASGVKCSESKTTVEIDTTPCRREQKVILTFIKPYTKKDVSDVTCGDKTHPRIQVTQK